MTRQLPYVAGMPVEFLSDDQAAVYGVFSGPPSVAELDKFFLLDAADREPVEVTGDPYTVVIFQIVWHLSSTLNGTTLVRMCGPNLGCRTSLRRSRIQSSTADGLHGAK
jgi:hypothetical protein